MSCRLPLVSTPEERLVVAGRVGSIRIRLAAGLALRSQPYNAAPIYVSDIESKAVLRCRCSIWQPETSQGTVFSYRAGGVRRLGMVGAEERWQPDGHVHT